ncbi:MAG TPA: ATP-binding protein, partial [Spirochaetaceae bacterium]|nr:ATP-binding protein [Spirochaetaceae bacterium]
MEDQAQKLRELMKTKPQGTQNVKKTRVIAVASGKGGVGKTNLS